MKEILKNRLFLSGSVFAIFVSFFYFYQYIYVFQLADNPSENKKYVKFSQDLNLLLKSSHLANYEKKIILGELVETNQALGNLLKNIDEINLESVNGTEQIRKRLENILKGSDIEGYLTEMKKEKKELLRLVVSFMKLSETNQWPTLIKISSTIVDKVSKLDLNTSLSELNVERNGIAKDINYMERITNVSSIDKKSKEIIKERADAINQRLESFQKSLVPLSMLAEQMDFLIKELNDWNKLIEEKAAGNLIVIENKELQIKNAKWEFVLFILVAIASLYLFSAMEKKRVAKIRSDEVLDVIKNSLFSTTFKDYTGEFGDEFNEGLQKYRSYLNKRIRFGALFQDSIPYSVAIFKDDKSFHWANKKYKEFNFSEVSLDDLLKNFELTTQDLLLEEKVMLNRCVSYDGGELNIFFSKSIVNDDNYFIFYANTINAIKKNKMDNEFEKLVGILEDEKIFSALPENPTAVDLAAHILGSNLANNGNQQFQNQLEDLENQVVDFHKMNVDISRFCRDVDLLNREFHDRNDKISRSLLEIITSKEDLENTKLQQSQKLIAYRDYNLKLINTIENVVKEIYELNDLAKRNELSYGQIKNELEKIYQVLANVEVLNDNLLEINLNQNEENKSIDAEILIADLLSEHFKSTDELMVKLDTINQMLMVGNASTDVKDVEVFQELS